MPSEVIVIGAGVIGCAVAYELTNRGATVTMVDPRGAGSGATQASAGVLSPHIEGHDNPTLTGLGVRSLAMYDAFIERVVAESGTAVPYTRSGTLETAFDDEASGSATIETYTVVHGRDGSPERGVVFARLPDEKRTVAVLPTDRDVLESLERTEGVGRRGTLTRSGTRNLFNPA